MTTPRSRTRGVAVLLAALLALAACSSGGSDLSPDERLAAAKKNLDETSGVHITLSTDKLPPTVNGLLRADGTATHAPAFKGAIKVAASGLQADADVVAVNGTVYAKLPFRSTFDPIDPADYGAPDPADLMGTEDGLSSLLTAAEDVTEGKQQRNGKVVLDTYTATVPGKAVTAVIPSASATADFDATFTVDDQDRLGQAVLTGPFYPKADDVTYTITFDDYGAKPSITAP
jgi:lipoprotein LprG